MCTADGSSEILFDYGYEFCMCVCESLVKQIFIKQYGAGPPLHCGIKCSAMNYKNYIFSMYILSASAFDGIGFGRSCRHTWNVITTILHWHRCTRKNTTAQTNWSDKASEQTNERMNGRAICWIVHTLKSYYCAFWMHFLRIWWLLKS